MRLSKILCFFQWQADQLNVWANNWSARQITLLCDNWVQWYYWSIIRSSSFFCSWISLECELISHFNARAITIRRKVWFHLCLSRILFAAKHSWTTLCMSRGLFVGSSLQVMWWALGPVKRKKNLHWMIKSLLEVLWWSQSVQCAMFLFLNLWCSKKWNYLQCYSFLFALVRTKFSFVSVLVYCVLPL